MNNFRIVVIQAGWVLAGQFSIAKGVVTLKNCTVIQRWGTTKGLGELALSGPTKESIIHPCGTAEIPGTAVLYTLTVDPKIATKWPH